MIALGRRFGLGTGLAGLVVGAWGTPQSFEFTIQRRRFLATIGEGGTFTVSEL